MSDRPLFQNTDEQEEAYAPQELPVGTAGERRAADEEGRDASGADVGAAGVLTGAAGGAVATGALSGNVGTTTGVTPAGPAASPAIGAAALAQETEDNRTRDR
jgi:hypothetical protein